jgi:hypothetical protein
VERKSVGEKHPQHESADHADDTGSSDLLEACENIMQVKKIMPKIA